jgi:SAM-dependent MidA family methyltransferase
LPVHRVAWTDGRLREVYVDWVDGFVERLGEPSTPALGAWLSENEVAPAEGWRGAICLGLEPTLQAVAGLVPRGVVLTIDYGDVMGEVDRSGDGVLAYHRHQWTDDVYARVGEQDLTCKVDFGALLRIGRKYGLEPAGITTQREFLLRLGLAREAERWANREASPGKQWEARFALAELVRPDGLGRLKVVAQRRGPVDCSLGRD